MVCQFRACLLILIPLRLIQYGVIIVGIRIDKFYFKQIRPCLGLNFLRDSLRITTP